MSYASINGVRLYYESVGSGTPIVFIHEVAGDYRSWEPQLREFARSHTCITFSARGYAPSEVPADIAAYSQQQSANDVIGLLDHLNIERAHFVGLSMGGFVTCQIGMDFPERALSLTIAACGSGSEPHLYQEKQTGFRQMADMVASVGTETFVEVCDHDLTRASFKRKDPYGWAEFRTRLAGHDAQGLSLTLRGVQGARPSLWDFETSLSQVKVPTLILCGDQDTPCLQPSLFLARTMPYTRLSILPDSGHVLNLEEPASFNRCLRDFIATTI